MRYLCKYFPLPYLPLRQLWKSKYPTQKLQSGTRHLPYKWCRVVYFHQLWFLFWKFCLFYLLEICGTLGPHIIILLWGCVVLVVQMCYRGAAVLSNFRLHWILLLQKFSCLLSYISGSWHNVSNGPNQDLGLISCVCLVTNKGTEMLSHCQL